MQLFNRKIEIIIGKLGGEGKSYKDLRVSFDILKTNSKKTNRAEFTIYNLSKSSRALLEEPNTALIFRAGYGEEQNLHTVYVGDIIAYEHDKGRSQRNNDGKTKITCKDGFDAISNSKLSLSFAENSSTLQIIDKIVAEMNLTKSDYSKITNLNYAQGFSFAGKPGKALDIILKRIGYEWSINNNALIINKIGEPTSETVAQYLSKESGLIQAPTRFKEKPVALKRLENPKTIKSGWKFTSLLIPTLAPKSIVRVLSEEVNGDFQLLTVNFKGDTHDNEWQAEMEAKQK